MMNAQARQEELDAFARTYGWRRGRFGSWHERGYTVSVGSTGQPRKFVVAKRGRTKTFSDLEDVKRFVRGDRLTP